MEEGHYKSKYSSPIGTILGKKKKDDSTAPGMLVSSKMLDSASKSAEKYFWIGIAALLTAKGYIFGTFALAVGGMGFVTREYRKAKKSRTEQITETNFSGQVVRGRRADLYHLHKAQEDLLRLESHFKRASMESRIDTVRDILGKVENLKHHVEVIDAGPYPGSSTTQYSFSKSAYLVIDDMYFGRAGNDNSLTGLDLKSAWDNVANKNDVVEKLVALQQTLPPDIIAEVNARVAQRQNMVNPHQNSGLNAGLNS